jgi:hypothetical protein
MKDDMRTIANTVITALIFAIPHLGYAGISSQDVKTKMMMDLDIIKNTFEVKYAPAEWKKIYADWELDTEIDLAKVKVLETSSITVKDYQRILLEFFNSPKDYHVGISFYSTETAVLPFRVHSAKGKYYVAWVMNSLFADLKKGDEVLLFDEKPIDEVVQELKKSEFGNPLSATDQALAESALTMRSGASGHIVPQGPVTITVRHLETNEVTTYRLTWFYQPEEISSSLSPLLAASESKLLQTNGLNYIVTKSYFKRPLGEHPFFYKDMTAPLFRQYKKASLRSNLVFDKYRKQENIAAGKDEDDKFIGAKESFVPILGELIWEAPKYSPFKAYLYLDKEGRKIGYIRIPHYSAGSQSVEKFAEIINYFQENTEALVIDQLNNPGGNMFYMYALASMLTEQPLYVPQQRMTITQEDVYFALDDLYEVELVNDDEEAREVLGSNLAGYPVDLDLARSMVNYFRFIITEWNEGRHLTDPGYIYGVDYLKPHPKGHYSKPILMLVNELDLSCGDFMPAILQDNKRVTLLGARTGGAGGYVLEHSYPNLFGIQGFSYTGSIAQRLDLNPIENLGVIPDILVEMTQRDLEGKYPDYTAKIHKAMSDLLNR